MTELFRCDYCGLSDSDGRKIYNHQRLCKSGRAPGAIFWRVTKGANMQENKKDRVVLGNVGVCPPEHAKKLIYYDRKTGDVVAVPPAHRALSPQEKARREAEAAQKSANWKNVQDTRKANRQAKLQAKVAKAKAHAAELEAKLKA